MLIKNLDQSSRRPAKTPVPGALPSTPAPSYRPELQAKVKYLSENESKVDQVFYCGKPGVPRIGSPRKIVQLPGEMIFFYEDISGDPIASSQPMAARTVLTRIRLTMAIQSAIGRETSWWWT